MSFKVLIFDVDGTLSETEEVHRQAFNRAFADAGLDWYWGRKRYRQLLTTSGGKERIRRHINEAAPSQNQRKNLADWILELHKSKTHHYTDIMAAGEIGLRSGIERIIHQAHESGIRLAIATTTSMANITALFAATLGNEVLEWFEVIGAAEQAPVKKPDPAVYQWVLKQLGLPASECLALEDTHNGVRAALGASIPVLVTQSYYSEGEDFSGALAVLSGLGEPEKPCQVLMGMPIDNPIVNLEQLQCWHDSTLSN